MKTFLFPKSLERQTKTGSKYLLTYLLTAFILISPNFFASLYGQQFCTTTGANDCVFGPDVDGPFYIKIYPYIIRDQNGQNGTPDWKVL